jgi:hypothetical protein
MDLESHESVASVALAHVRVSEDELEVYVAVLNHALEVLTPDEIEGCTGAAQDELEAIRDDVVAVLQEIRSFYEEPLPAEARRQS